jgi:leucyl/phenylalanyl-tRNA--protein transferase
MYPYIINNTIPPFFPDFLTPDDNGLVAIGGSLSSQMLIEAYSKGIFPWSGEDPIPWYSPDHRLVLFPEQFHVSESLRKIINKKTFEIKADSNFDAVIKSCSLIKRKGQRGTWIDENIIGAYSELFDLGIAHSVEVYYNGKLCGGLYGIALGKCFFGESMFSMEPNSSKIALFFLTRILIRMNFIVIDCQQVTPHMMSLGAVPILRSDFFRCLKAANIFEIKKAKWEFIEPQSNLNY